MCVSAVLSVGLPRSRGEYSRGILRTFPSMPDNEINSVSILFEVGKESSNELQICVSALHGDHEADSSLNRSRRRG
jgi:hypothetical protein